MERIASFCVDHTRLTEGMYTSRIDRDVVTYDLRCCRPNCGQYLENAAIHTVEHLFATFVRNSPKADSVIYFGPMGCRTGFYFLVSGLTEEEAIALTQDAFRFIAAYEGPIPGASAVECGNYLEHDLDGAKRIAAHMCGVLAGWTPDRLAY